MSIIKSKRIIEYAARELLSRAGVQPGVVNIKYGSDFIFNNQANKTVHIHTCHPESFKNIINFENNSLDKLYGKQIHPLPNAVQQFDELPVLSWGNSNKKIFAEIVNDELIIYPDIIAATIFMLTRWEETIIKTRDEHDRFPAKESVAYKQGFLNRPIIDEYAVILGEWLKLLLPGWQPEKREYQVILSHDIDSVYYYRDFFSIIKMLSGDILKRRDIIKAHNTFKEGGKRLVKPSTDPYIRAIRELASLSKKNGMESEFYFKASEPSPFDSGYDIGSSIMREIINELKEAGFVVGLHPGYETHKNFEKLIEEKNRFQGVTGLDKIGGRQHYLRFEAPTTWRLWEKVGLDYDSTVGYADHEGFRCGTCWPFYPYDIEEDRIINVTEIPLIVMDGMLKGYRGLNPAESEKKIIALAQRCKNVSGIFTLLWHNRLIYNDCVEWWEIYQGLINGAKLN